MGHLKTFPSPRYGLTRCREVVPSFGQQLREVVGEGPSRVLHPRDGVVDGVPLVHWYGVAHPVPGVQN